MMMAKIYHYGDDDDDDDDDDGKDSPFFPRLCQGKDQLKHPRHQTPSVRPKALAGLAMACCYLSKE